MELKNLLHTPHLNLVRFDTTKEIAIIDKGLNIHYCAPYSNGIDEDALIEAWKKAVDRVVPEDEPGEREIELSSMEYYLGVNGNVGEEE